MKTKYCPNCDADISESYQPQEDDVGIGGGWYCEKCDEAFPDEYDDDPDIA